MKALPISRRLWRIPLIPPDILNVYLVGDVLIDSGVRPAHRRLLNFLSGQKLSAHALTHAHPDHQGCSHAICDGFQVPLLCGEGDREAQETGRFEALMPRPGSLLARVSGFLSGPPHPVSRALKEGDEMGGLRVVETPGHTPGHLAFFEEEERVLILGDVLFHRNPVTFRKGLTEPIRFATWDRMRNLDSARKLASLTPRVVCFGHGAPLLDGDRFCRFVEELPQPEDLDPGPGC